MSNVYILQGLPGSGKSTYKALLQARSPRADLTFSADDYFIGDNGYVFNKDLLGDAHRACMKKFAIAVTRLHDSAVDMIVDNTNTTLQEIIPYYRLADAFGCNVEIHYIDCDLETAIARGIHNVPRKTVERMYDNLQYFHSRHAHQFVIKNIANGVVCEAPICFESSPRS